MRLVWRLSIGPAAAVNERRPHAGGAGADAIEGMVGDVQHFMGRDTELSRGAFVGVSVLFFL